MNEETECQHDFANPVRKGRAFYVCKDCGKDISLLLFFIFVLEEETKESSKK